MPFPENVTFNATNVWQAERFPPSASQALVQSSTINPSGNVLPITNALGSTATLSSTPTIAVGMPGQVITLVNTSSLAIILQDQSVLASSGLRLLSGGVLPLFQYNSASFLYDSTLAAWTQIDAFQRQWLHQYSPDTPPTSPNIANDEFDGSSGITWTNYGNPDTVANNTTWKGFVELEDNDNTGCGIYQSFAPGAAAFTVAAKFSYHVANGGFNFAAITVTDSAGTNISVLGPQNDNAGGVRNQGNNAAFVGVVDNNKVGSVYVALTRDSGTTYTNYISNDGLNWWAAESAAVHAGTVARLTLEIDGITGNTTMLCDWVRVFTSQTTVVGSA